MNTGDKVRGKPGFRTGSFAEITQSCTWGLNILNILLMDSVVDKPRPSKGTGSFFSQRCVSKVSYSYGNPTVIMCRSWFETNSVQERSGHAVWKTIRTDTADKAGRREWFPIHLKGLEHSSLRIALIYSSKLFEF